MSNLKTLEFVDLKPYTTFRMGSLARFFIVVNNTDELQGAFAFAESKGLPVFVLGGGSNILLSETKMFEAVVIKIEMPGFSVQAEDENFVTVKVGAGENWDLVVARVVDMNLSGIEALSAIPGTAGATPIQNVGAYGREISDVLVSLEAYEIASNQLRTITTAECQFKYRDSIFKNEAKGQFVICSISIQLKKLADSEVPSVPDYPGVKKYFDEKGIGQPTLQQIRQAIIDIRAVKLPDPKQIASVGSFFKNPFVDKQRYEQLKKEFPNIIAFEMENGSYKIGAGWLLETLGYKGKQVGKLQFYPRNALVITNVGGAGFEELKSLVEETKTKVSEKYGIEIEMEPLVI